MFVTTDFKQGTDATIVAQFDNLVEIETSNPEAYSTWEVIDTDGSIAALRDAAIMQNNKTKGIIYTLNGVDYKVPLTSEDAVGLMQVSSAFTLGLTSTNIHFSNGTVMPISDVEFTDFATWFVTERNKFFA